MKKIICFVAVTVLLLFAACGKQSDITHIPEATTATHGSKNDAPPQNGKQPEQSFSVTLYDKLVGWWLDPLRNRIEGEYEEP